VPTVVTAQTPTKAAALQLGSTPWPPFTDAPGKARFAIELVHAALKRINLIAETAIVPDGALTPALLERRFHGSPALWRDAEREKTLIFSKPYLENRLVLVAKKGVDVSAPALPALAGRRIAIVNGYAYGAELESPRGPSFVATSSFEEGLQKVLAGEADYALMDALVVEYLVMGYPEETKTRLAIGTVPLVVRPLHFALRRDVPGAQSIIDNFNGELTRMIADRSYHQLLHLGWITADVDGDGRMEWIPATDQAGHEAPARRYELVTVTASTNASPAPGKLRIYLGGKVYEGWTDVPEKYKMLDTKRTAWDSQIAPLFSFKW
jgi:polar amino acid transport system substrate-binding protein